MLEELLEAGSTIKVGQLRSIDAIIAYQMTQATYSIDLVLKQFMIIYMGLSMRPEMDHCQCFMIRMSRAPCAVSTRGTILMIPDYWEHCHQSTPPGG